MNISQMRSELDRLKQERNNVEQTWDLIKRLIVPYRGDFFKGDHGENSIEWRTGQDVFDSTAIIAAQILAASLHSSLTSQSIRWFSPKWSSLELQSNQKANEWLEAAADKMYSQLQRSNFDLEVSEMYIDLVSFGTAFFSEETENEITGDITFQSIPVENSYFVQGHKGHAVRYYRTMRWTPTQIFDKFGDKTPEDIAKKAKEGKDSEKYEVVYAVYERKIEDPSSTQQYPLPPEKRPIGWCYFLYQDSFKLDEGGYYELPIFVPRWRRTNNSQWGNGPGMLALPDTITLNRLIEMVLKSAEKVIDPATITTERDLLSDLDLQAGGLTIVRDIKNIAPYESRARFDVSQLRIQDLQMSINRIFHVDQLELKDSPTMTATEVQVRYELMQRLLGPTLGRLKTDFLDPMLQRTFNIMYRAGKFGDLPDSVKSDELFTIEYTGPFARAQKIDVARSIMEWLAYIAQVADMFPDAMDLPDIDKMARELASLTSVPSRLLKDAAAVASSRKARQQQQQQAVGAQAAEQQSKAELNIAKAMSEVRGV